MAKPEVKKNEVAAVNPDLPAYLQNKAGAPRGAEHVGHEDLVIPRLEVVQALSKCRKKSEATYIEGAEEGMLYNSVTRELYGPEVVLVPVAFKKDYLLWMDIKKGGGFKGAYPTLEQAEAARAAMPEADDIEINDTAQHFCLMLKPNNKIEEIVVSMAKSKLKTSRKWNSLIRISEADSFAKAYKMSAVALKNAANQDYFGLDVSGGVWVPEDVHARGEKLWKQVEAGAVKASTEFEEIDPTVAAGSGEY